MIQEKLNSGNWKEGLEDVSNLPEYFLQNKQAAWDKLDNRLHEKKHRINFAWYWVAAACLIIVSSIILITTGKKNNAVVINTPIKSHEKIIPQQQSNKENIEIKTIASTSIKKKIPVTNNTKSSANIIHAKEKTANDSITQTAVINTESQTVLPVVKDSIKQNIIAIIPLQKKMKVVHVNELDDNNNTNITQSSGHLPLRIKFLNQDIYTDYTVRPATTGFNILKLNASPSN